MSQLQRKMEEVKPPKSQGEKKGRALQQETLQEEKRQLQMPLKGAKATEERLGCAGCEGD